MKQNRLVVAGLLAVIALVVVIAVVAFSRTNLIANPAGYPTPTNNIYVSGNPSLIPTTDPFKTFTYDQASIVRPFTVKYPVNWKERIDTEDGGTWDILLTKDQDVIQIDFTGLDIKGIDEAQAAVNDWVTNFGSYKNNTTSIEKETGFASQGKLMSSRQTGSDLPYKIFELTDKTDSHMFYFAVAQVSQIEAGELGYLGIETNNLNSLNDLKQILGSVSYK